MIDMVHLLPSITGRKIRFSLVGCGQISKNHFEALKQHADRAELIGMCDIDPKALHAAASITGAKSYKNISNLLAESNADIVVLARRAGCTHSKPFRLPNQGGTS